MGIVVTDMIARVSAAREESDFEPTRGEAMLARVVAAHEEMVQERLIVPLRRLQGADDREIAHETADALLLDYIDDDDVRAAFDAIEKWYA